MSRPDRLEEDQRIFLKHLLERCPELNTLHTRVRAFAGVFTKRSSGLLDRWITQVNNDWIAPLTHYAAGLLDDLDAVRAGATLPHRRPGAASAPGTGHGRPGRLRCHRRPGPHHRMTRR